jgi:hypothetical protein
MIKTYLLYFQLVDYFIKDCPPAGVRTRDLSIFVLFLITQPLSSSGSLVSD